MQVIGLFNSVPRFVLPRTSGLVDQTAAHLPPGNTPDLRPTEQHMSETATDRAGSSKSHWV
eukprot:2320553-Rhodomonas_salina.3